jgi:hypothetical protein
MPFPQSVLPIKQEMLIGGTWTDITAYTRDAADVNITRGFSGQQSALAPGSATFTANNRDYFFSNRSPSSVNYKVIGRNTQYRVSLTEATPWLWMNDYSDSDGNYDGARAGTADKAVLDITGDIDIRVDCRPDNLRGGHGMVLASKYNTGSADRSWLFWLDRMGYLRFRWSTDGTSAGAHDVISTATVSALRRQAFRVTLDVNNGGGGWTLTFYTADTISGSWTQLGSTAGSTPTTSIYSGGAALFVGAIQLSTATSGTYGRNQFSIGGEEITNPFVGRIYRAQVYSGIGGTLVADMNATAQTAGTTSWSDGLATANTWVLRGSAEITKQNYRFWGELGDLPQEWDVSGTDIFGQMTPYDILSRLQQGAKSLQSAVYRNLIRFSNTSTGTSGTLDGYWPMENGSQATTPSPAVGTYGTMSNAAFGTDEDFPGTTGVLTFSSDAGKASGGGLAISTTSSTGVVTLLLYFRAPSVPGADVNLINFYLVAGTTYRVAITVSTATYKLDITNSSGTSLLSTTVAFGTGGEPDQPLAMRVMLTQNGGNVDYEWAWYPIGGANLFGVSGNYAGTVGRSKNWISPAFTGKSGWWIAHVATMREDVDWEGSAFIGSTNAYVDERAEDRFARLCREQGVPYWIVGRTYSGDFEPGVGEPCGPQTSQSFVALITECANLDRGLIYAPRDKFGLTLRLHNSLINRECVELDYAQNHLSSPLVPRDDLYLARNDVTVQNGTGGSARYVRTSGTLNVNEPSTDQNGIGTFDPGPVTRIASDDDRLPALAQEEVFLGTWDELRYPSVTVRRERSVIVADTLLDADILDADLGDALRLVNLPAQLPPDGVELLMIGYAENLQNRGHGITWNTQPYGPYRSLNDLSGSDLARARLAASSSFLTSSLTSGATSFTVTTSTGLLWRTGSSSPTFPIEIMIGGEEMSVGSIAGATSPQTFSSVTRSVNGEVLAHDALTVVQVRDAFYIGRDNQ